MLLRADKRVSEVFVELLRIERRIQRQRRDTALASGRFDPFQQGPADAPAARIR